MIEIPATKLLETSMTTPFVHDDQSRILESVHSIPLVQLSISGKEPTCR